ncbi:MAG: DNA mismatch repair protein MutS [Pseudomonadota bacterium]
MMAQYLDIKRDHPDALLFYRMGDFYELFFEDAQAAAAALDIALTKRGKHLGEDIPMCGVPFHAADGYLQTLIRKGFRVAVCEQQENPAEARKRGSKAVVKRAVERVVTPGTLTEDSLLQARHSNFLAAFARVRDDAALAWLDISTGDFSVTPCTPLRLGPDLARIRPAELLLADPVASEIAAIVSDIGVPVTEVLLASFDSSQAGKRLASVLGEIKDHPTDTFGRAELSAMGALLDYLDQTQKGQMPLLRVPRRIDPVTTVQIDPATRRNLELTHALSGGRAGSLLSVVDRTVTPAGARLLEHRLTGPIRDLEEIRRRHDAIDFFLADPALTETVRAALRRSPDMDRALQRLSLGRGGPRDLVAIRNGLRLASDLSGLFQAELLDLLSQVRTDLTVETSLKELLDTSLKEETPLLVRDGDFVAPGYHAPLDELRQLRDQSRSVVAGMQGTYQTDTGVGALKVKHNNVLGYFIETPATHAERMLSAPLSETFIHRQTTANAVRFTTLELSELETRILNAGGEALEQERVIFEHLRQKVIGRAADIWACARAIAELDLATALTDLAATEGWVRPKIDDSRTLDVIGGRHPVVERSLKQQGGTRFVANDCRLGDQGGSIWLLTGPNMAGKSTFLRQNAIIALLAQMGAFVPARSAHIGLVSQFFSRVGAADDLARGRSTFMVEMVETAAILNQADDRALVILDEIGRGTATYDGLSIAWATLEHLNAVNRCRALFATHYHELTQHAARLDGVENATVAVKDWKDEVIFLHEVRKGAADRSYGVQVAKLAGLPQSVVDRARDVLDSLEQAEREGGKIKAVIDDLPLFSAAAQEPKPTKVAETRILDRLADVNPDAVTARQALDLLYELKKLAGSDD